MRQIKLKEWKRRTFKFRAWLFDYETDAWRMVEWFPRFFSDVSPVTDYSDWFPNDDDKVILLEWSGMHDVDGNEIYEGDIVELASGDESVTATVEFEYGCFVLSGSGFGNSRPELKYYVDMPFCTCRVVGNIWEYPEEAKE